MQNILDPKFKYVPSAKSDIRKTFARIRAAQKRSESKPASVIEIKRRER